VGVVALALGGCGAKTGLKVPDAEPENMLDAGVDAGPDAGPDADIPCFEVPFDGGPVEVSLQTEAVLGRADVTFLIDTTASMQDEIDRIRSQLRDRLAPAISEAIPDSQLAVATFADFPIDPYGDSGQDLPFRLMLPSSPDVTRVQAAVNSIELGDGRDEPESQVEALYHLATGTGHGEFIEPSAGCPSGGIGYACFRTDALPVVLLFTDAPFHNGPGGGHPYGSGIRPPPHDYSDALNELQAIEAHVIGFASGSGDGERDMRVLARDTRAFDESGDPLVFDIGRRGERLGTDVVSAIQTFADTVVFDVDAIAVDPEPGDDVDVTNFIQSIEPLSAQPMEQVESIDREAGIFRGVRAGTLLDFQLVIRNDAVVPGTEPKAFDVQIVFRGDDRALLGRRLVQIVIPAEDGDGCEALGEGDAGR
jgi:hypothetical protein